MRAENVPSATVAGSRQQTAAPAELPFWIPGVGAWPGHVITRMDGDKPVLIWRYEAPGPNRSRISGQRPVVDLLRLTPEDAQHILDALTPPPAAARSCRASWTRWCRELLKKVMQGAPLEVAEALAELRAVKLPRKLSFNEKRMLETATALLRSALDALPDSRPKQRALEILDDRKPCPPA